MPGSQAIWGRNDGGILGRGIHQGGKERPVVVEIADEIRQFLHQKEVRDGLGFDPLSCETPFTVTLLAQRLSDRGIFRMFGRTDNQDIFIQARLFVNPVAPPTDTDAAHAPDPDTARKVNMLRILGADLRRYAAGG